MTCGSFAISYDSIKTIKNYSRKLEKIHETSSLNHLQYLMLVVLCHVTQSQRTSLLCCAARLRKSFAPKWAPPVRVPGAVRFFITAKFKEWISNPNLEMFQQILGFPILRYISFWPCCLSCSRISVTPRPKLHIAALVCAATRPHQALKCSAGHSGSRQTRCGFPSTGNRKYSKCSVQGSPCQWQWHQIGARTGRFWRCED